MKKKNSFYPNMRNGSLYNHCIEELDKKHGLHSIKENRFFGLMIT